MSLNLITLKQFQAITNVEALKSEDKDTAQYFLDLADSLISSYELDTTKAGYASAVRFAVHKVTEALFNSNTAQSVADANSVFKSEKFGSYSYTKFTVTEMNQANTSRGTGLTLLDELEPLAASIIRRYLKTNIRSINTAVFIQDKPDSNGNVKYQDFLDDEIIRFNKELWDLDI